MPRVVSLLLLGGVVIISAILTVGLSRGDQATADPVGNGPAGAGWFALPQSEQLAYIRQYQRIVRGSDASVVFKRARLFTKLSPADQERLRALHVRLRQVLDNLPVSRQLALSSLHERARAEELYRLLRAEAPEIIAEFHQRP
ncbi:MAG: hypothetical protein ABIG44_00700 [Planctomycetota bacterium]